MKLINWKLRFKNKISLAALIAATIAFVYQILGIFEIVPAVSQDTIEQLAGIIINLLVAFGIVVDPSTHGLKDTAKVMTYQEPRNELEAVDDESEV